MKCHFVSCKYSFTTREGNKVVHGLAQFVLTKPNIVWMETVSDLIQPICNLGSFTLYPNNYTFTPTNYKKNPLLPFCHLTFTFFFHHHFQYFSKLDEFTPT